MNGDQVFQLFLAMAGGVIGFGASWLMLQRKFKEERNRTMADYCIRMITACDGSVRYIRSALYAKAAAQRGDADALRRLEDSPVAELGAITSLFFDDAAPKVQELLDLTHEIYATPADEITFEIAEEKLRQAKLSGDAIYKIIVWTASRYGWAPGSLKRFDSPATNK